VHPECEQGDPTREAVKGLKMVMELPSDAWVRRDKNYEEHCDHDPTRDHVDESVFLPILGPLLRCQDGVSQIPGGSSDSGTTVKASVVEHLGQAFSDAQWPRMRSKNGDFVAKINKFFLSK
jgi:hypothetical protein